MARGVKKMTSGGEEGGEFSGSGLVGGIMATVGALAARPGEGGLVGRRGAREATVIGRDVRGGTGAVVGADRGAKSRDD